MKQNLIKGKKKGNTEIQNSALANFSQIFLQTLTYRVKKKLTFSDLLILLQAVWMPVQLLWYYCKFKILVKNNWLVYHKAPAGCRIGVYLHIGLC